MLSDPETKPEIKAKLRLTQQILGYAAQAGLNTDGAYTHYIETGQRRVSYLVQAAYADRLQAVTWWFPFVGRVPYLGFFEEKDRDEKALELADQGYDVYTTGVGAFSSLGWFSDPIFTSMLRRDVEDLASLYFHELTHRTFWISGSVQFNENLAEYVADYLTPRFLQTHGYHERIEDYRALHRDRDLFKAWLERLRVELERLYNRSEMLGKEQTLAQKIEIFERYTTIDKPKFQSLDFIGRRRWNNATVISARLYQPDLDRFARSHACLGETSIIGFLEALDNRADEMDDPFKALDSFCTLSKQ